MDKIIKPEGFDRGYVNSRSFYELEEEMHIGHYNLYGFSRTRKGYIPVSSFSRQRIEDNIRYILE